MNSIQKSFLGKHGNVYRARVEDGHIAPTVDLAYHGSPYAPRDIPKNDVIVEKADWFEPEYRATAARHVMDLIEEAEIAGTMLNKKAVY